MKSTATRHDMFVEKFAAIPEIAKLGPLFKSSAPAELTGNETDLVI
jgi:coatomer protein complex subunit gamma